MNKQDGPFGPVVNGTMIVFFEYRPNKAAGYSFTALFGLLTLGHLVFIFWRRAWFFIPFFFGGLAETFGYYGRALASGQPNIVGPFILQNLLILVATPFLAASVYMSLGRVITALDAKRYAIMNMRWMTSVYVLVDIGCIDYSFGGLITQLVALSLFLFTSWHAHVRIRRDAPEMIQKDSRLRWQNHFKAIECVALLMIVRSLVRTIEYLQGEGGYIITHEVFLYAFDAALMAIAMLVFLFVYPGKLLQDSHDLKSCRRNPES
ncbi:RTA1 like protein-domain-containing protein [Rhexocercosporidium sp. MPI-PUGE-AT-0058]|nr:RTA1 like protein-domain-containing protein [Rhexocercosporidium sp. MPI-PUGE-AT-0058]